MTGALATRPGAERLFFGGNKRAQGGTRTRFVGTGHHGDRNTAELDPWHPAVVEGRTLFPKSVVAPGDAPRVLVSGINNAKLGRIVEKGDWAGMPIYTLTLEERATCPASCHHWRACFGSAMPFARRHRHGSDLVRVLDRELRHKAVEHKSGFVVRLHVLGDFYDTEYVGAWAQWMLDLPGLRVFGYTARQPDTELGEMLAVLNRAFPTRWAMRFSGTRHALPEMRVVTLWKERDGELEPLPDATLMCPQSADKTACCSTCGLCWAPSMFETRIAFIGHGLNVRGRQ